MEGIRYELVEFARTIEKGKRIPYISHETIKAISNVMEDFINKKDCFTI